jgi:hypothetical protein
MNTIKVFYASLIWLVFFYVLTKPKNIIIIADSISSSSKVLLMNITNWVLGIAWMLSILMITYGSIGYAWNNYKSDKGKKRKFEEMLICGIIILITASLSYAMVIVPSAPPVY